MAYSYRFINPKLTGIVVKEKVKCGKPNCRCNNGKLHKWYYYLYFRKFIGGKWKLCKEYVAKTKVKYLRGKIKMAKEKEKQQKLELKENLALLRLIKHLSKNHGVA